MDSHICRQMIGKVVKSRNETPRDVGQSPPISQRHHYFNYLSTDQEPLHQAIIMAVRLSGLQREVIALYRQCLRESRKKPEVCKPQFAIAAIDHLLIALDHSSTL